MYYYYQDQDHFNLVKRYVCIYLDITFIEHSKFSISTFQVIYGNVDVSVFSKLKPHQIRQLDIPQVLRDKSHLIDQGFVFPSYREAFKSISEEHEALLLTPGKLAIKNGENMYFQAEQVCRRLYCVRILTPEKRGIQVNGNIKAKLF